MRCFIPIGKRGPVNLRKTATSQELERAGSDFGRARGHGDGGGRREGGWRWSPSQAYSTSPPTIGFLQIAGLMLRKPELEQRDSREYGKFCGHSTDIFASRTSSWSLCSWQSTEGGSHWLQGTCGREAVSTCCAGGRSKLLLILPKMRCVWFGFDMTPSTGRRPFCTTVDCTIL